MHPQPVAAHPNPPEERSKSPIHGLRLSLNGERQPVDDLRDTLPAAAANVAAMYCALARDISSTEHTTPISTMPCA